MSKEQIERSLLVEVARLYYEQHLTQTEIGHRVNSSRSTVSRLLQEARERGIVTITIDYDVVRDEALEAMLQETFNLNDVRVLRSFDRSSDVVRRGMGQLAARVLEGVVSSGAVLGISYGRSVADTVTQVKPMQTNEVMIVPIIGALGTDNPLIEGIDLARELARKLSARYRYLHAPLLVESRHMRDALMQATIVQDVLRIAAASDSVLIGVGSLLAEDSGLIWTGYISPEERRRLLSIGVAGHMCAQFFDTHGTILDIDINHRAISIGLEILRSTKNVIAVSGGADKATAILGALNGGYIDILVTDDQAAMRILEMRRASN